MLLQLPVQQALSFFLADAITVEEVNLLAKNPAKPTGHY
jgi:hypothetical protein